MSTQLRPVDLTEITLMSKLKTHLQGELNPAINSIKMAAKPLNESKDEDIPDDVCGDRVDENGVSDFGKDAEEDEMQGVKRDPQDLGTYLKRLELPKGKNYILEEARKKIDWRPKECGQEELKKIFSQQWEDEGIESLWVDKTGEKVVTLTQVAHNLEEQALNESEFRYKLTLYQIDKKVMSTYFTQMVHSKKELEFSLTAPENQPGTQIQDQESFDFHKNQRSVFDISEEHSQIVIFDKETYNFYVAHYTDSSSLEHVFENQKAKPLTFSKHPFVFTLEDLTNLFWEDIRIKLYQLLNIYVVGEYLKIHFGFVDRTESDYAANYLNYLIIMKSRIADKELKLSEPEEDHYFAANGQKIFESSDTYKYFDCLSDGQLFRYNTFSLVTECNQGEDSVHQIYFNENPSQNYECKEDSKLSDIQDECLYGLDFVKDRLAVMVSRNEIRYLDFDHENKTYAINDKITIEIDKKAVKDDEILWLLKIDGDEIYFAVSKESHDKDYIAIIRYDTTTKKFDHILTVEEENNNAGWIPSKQPPGLSLIVYSPQRLISMQKISVTQDLEQVEDEDDLFKYVTQERRILRKGELINMTALADDMLGVANLKQTDIQLIMVNKALTYGIINQTNDENWFLWDISQGLMYRIRNDMYFVQHSFYQHQTKDQANISFDLFYFETGNLLQVLSFKHNGEFQYLEWVLPTNDKPKSLFISHDGSHLLAEHVIKTEADGHKGATKPQGPDQSKSQLLPSLPIHDTSTVKEIPTKSGKQVTNASGKGGFGVSMSVRQKARDQKSQYYQAQLEYEFGSLRVKQGESVIEKIEEVIQNQAFREKKQQSEENNENYVRYKEIFTQYLTVKNIMRTTKLPQMEICTFRKWILVRFSDPKLKDQPSSIHFFNPQEQEFDFMIDFPFTIQRIEVDNITNEIYLSIPQGNQFKICHLKLFTEEPGSIPEYIINKKSLFTVLDLKQGLIRYHENFSSRNQTLAQVSIYQDQKVWDEQAVLNFINQKQSEMSIEEVFGINLIYRFQIIQLILAMHEYKSERRMFFHSLMRKLEEPKYQKHPIPLLPMDISISSNPNYRTPEYSLLYLLTEIDLVSLKGELIEIILNHMISTDTTGQLYESIVENTIEKIAEEGVNLKAFLRSKQAYLKVNTEDGEFKELLHINQPIFISNDQSIEEVLKHFTKNIEEPNKQAEKTCWRVLRSFFLDSKSEEKRVVYHIVNLKRKLSIENSLNFLQMIYGMADHDISVMDIPCIRTVIEYKWQIHTYQFFFRQLLAILIFYIAFVIDIYFWMNKDDDNYQLIAFIITRIICGLLVLYIFSHELRQVTKNSGIVEYFSQFWNYNDILFFLVYPTYVVVAFARKDELYVIKVLQSVIVFVSFIKIQFLIRIFDGLSFLVQMLANVFKDIGYFLLFFAIVIGAFATAWTIIVDKVPDNYEGINRISYFIMGLRRALGDNDTDELVTNSEYKALAWIFWLAIVIVGNIVFTNFVIAVVGTSYEACMENSEQQSYKAKLHMIIERESILFDWQRTANQQAWFPNYIIRVQELDEHQDDEVNDAQATTKAISELKKQVDNSHSSITKEIKKMSAEMNEKIARIEAAIGKMVGKEPEQVKQDDQEKPKDEDESSGTEEEQESRPERETINQEPSDQE